MCFQNLKSSNLSGYEYSNAINLFEQKSSTPLTETDANEHDEELDLETVEAAMLDEEANDIIKSLMKIK